MNPTASHRHRTRPTRRPSRRRRRPSHRPELLRRTRRAAAARPPRQLRVVFSGDCPPHAADCETCVPCDRARRAKSSVRRARRRAARIWRFSRARPDAATCELRVSRSEPRDPRADSRARGRAVDCTRRLQTRSPPAPVSHLNVLVRVQYMSMSVQYSRIVQVQSSQNLRPL